MGVRIIRYCGTWLLLSAICMANDATHRADIQAADCAGNAIIRRAVEAALLGRVRAPEEIQRLPSIRCSVPVAMSRTLAVIRVLKDPVLQTIELRLGCIPKESCLPFLVTVPEKSMATQEDAASKQPRSPQPRGANSLQPIRQNKARPALVVPGQVVTLEWERETVHLTRKVICLDRGNVGEEIWTRPIGVGHRIRAQVIDSGRVKAIL